MPLLARPPSRNLDRLFFVRVFADEFGGALGGGTLDVFVASVWINPTALLT